MGLLRFSAHSSIGTITAAKNSLILTAPSTHHFRVLYANFCGATTITAAQWSFGLYSTSAAGTGAITAVTPTNMVCGSTVASSATCGHTHATTEPTLVAVPLWHKTFLTTAGCEFSAVLAGPIYVPASGILVCRLSTASVTSSTINTHLVWEELESGTPFPPLAMRM